MAARANATIFQFRRYLGNVNLNVLLLNYFAVKNHPSEMGGMLYLSMFYFIGGFWLREFHH